MYLTLEAWVLKVDTINTLLLNGQAKTYVVRLFNIIFSGLRVSGGSEGVRAGWLVLDISDWAHKAAHSLVPTAEPRLKTISFIFTG